jgi:carbon-monoxide dehydrogenase large subunit
VTKYVGVDDCGRVLNPMIVEGQMHGGIIQGLGEALYEEIKYDEDGQLLTATLMDYTIPGVIESPEMILERTETPADSPLGLKGIGEAGTTVATPAILNAVADALAAARATITTLPARSEAVWSSLRKGRDS